MDKKDSINPKVEPTEPKTEPTEPSNIPTAVTETSSSQPTDTDVTPKPPQTPTLPTTASTSTPANAPPKRTFMPNIGVQRVKKEVKEDESKPQSTRKPPQPNLSKSARGGRGGARGANNNNSNVIQSHSIFEGGPGMSTKRFGGDRETYESTTRISGSVSSGISVKRESGGGVGDSSSRSIKVEETILIEDQKENDDQEIYVSLKCEAKDEPVVENLDLDGDDDLSGTNAQDNAKLREILDPQDPEEKFFKKEMKDRLVLFQIPETLNLAEMPEGHIGKLRIYESGKVEMVINDDKVFDVSLSVSGSFLQDAAAFEQIDEQTAELTQLGHILSKLVVSQQI